MINLGSLNASCEHLQCKVNDERWIGVDLDGTIAKYDSWKGWKFIGEPIPDMVKRVKEWIALGIRVKILTARCSKVSLARNNITFEQMTEVIQKWCEENIGCRLPVTCEKDCNMVFCVDDSAVQVKTNTGNSMADDGFDVFDDKIDEIIKSLKLKSNTVPGQEWLFQDWRDRVSQEKDLSTLSDEQIDALKKYINSADSKSVESILDSNILRKFSEYLSLEEYWNSIHFQYQRELNRVISPVYKKYRSLTNSDLSIDYDSQISGHRKGKLCDLEAEMTKRYEEFKKSPIYKKAYELSTKVRNSDKKTFRAAKFDKDKLLKALDLYKKVEILEYDDICNGFVFAEDHDEGYLEIKYRLENLVNNFRTKDGDDLDIDDCCLSFRWSIALFDMANSNYANFRSCLEWIVKRINVLARRRM